MTAPSRSLDIPLARSSATPSPAAARLRFALDPLRIVLFLLTVFTVSRVHQHYGFLSALRPGLLLFGLAVGFAVLTPRALAPDGIFRTWPAKIMAALGAVACLSAVFGISLGGSASYILSDYSKVLIYALLLVAAARGARDVALIVWGYVVSTGILVYMALYVFELQRGYGAVVARLNDMYSYDANDLGCVLLVGLPLTLLALQSVGKVGRIFCVLVLYGVGAAIARSGSRGALVGLVVVGLLLAITLRQISVGRRIGFVAVIALALVVTAPPGYWDQMRTILQPTQDYNWTARDGRKQVAKRGFDYMMQYPVFGLGINNFGRAEGTISVKATRHVEGQPGVRWTAAHNSYVQVGAELGITGLLLWVALIVGGIRSLLRLRRRLPERWRSGTPEQRYVHAATLYIPLALVGFAVSSAFVSFAYVDPIYILAALVAGTLVAARRELEREASEGAQVTPVTPAMRPGARIAPFVPRWGTYRNT